LKEETIKNGDALLCGDTLITKKSLCWIGLGI
jgi:hypothetical protein